MRPAAFLGVSLVCALSLSCAVSQCCKGGAAGGPRSASGNDGEAVTETPETLRVMSLNVRYGTAADGENAWDVRKHLLLETVTGFTPDLLGTQECLAFQTDFLREGLPGFEFFGVGRDDGALGGEMCGIFFREDLFERTDGGHFWLSETPEAVASKSWDSALTRMATWVVLSSKDDPEFSLVVANTHFDHVGKVARYESARVIRARLTSIAGARPLILMGDFNAPTDATVDGPYRVLVAPGASREGDGDVWLPLVDTFRAVSPTPRADEGTFHGFAGGVAGARVDWILASPSFEVLDARIDRSERAGRYPSDHYPVTAVLRRGAAGRAPASGAEAATGR
jgi:endonuclease/exonuclease/phosphatase family metal-dependent hydrolase